MTTSSQSAQPWLLVWSDEFSGTSHSRVNNAEWLYDVGTQYPGGPSQWGTGEVEVMTDSTDNVYHDGVGHLVIKPVHMGTSPTDGWTSGRIETQRLFDAPPGGAFAVEASIQQPNVSGAAAAGYWPAFWMLGSPFRGNYWNWPQIGEIDIMETVNDRDSTFAVFHCGTAPGGPCNEPNGIATERPCPGCRTGFHLYRVELDKTVTPQQIRWYLDGVNFFTVAATSVDPATWSAAMDHPFFVILNVAIGGGFPGAPTKETASGVPMLVDYVRVYKRAAEFTDEELVPGTTLVRAVHVIELRTRINALRQRFGVNRREWEEPLSERVTLIRASHLTELRRALSEAYEAAGREVPQFESSLAIGDRISAIHVAELRSAIATLE